MTTDATVSASLELVACTQTLLTEIADKRMKRNNVATTYALALRSSGPTDWATVNRAIMQRWSISGLRYIKERAWRIARGEVQP